MEDPIIAQYLQDETIPLAKRKAAAAKLDSGRVSEADAKGIIMQKYPGKYGGGVQGVGDKQPSLAASMGNIALKGAGQEQTAPQTTVPAPKMMAETQTGTQLVNKQNQDVLNRFSGFNLSEEQKNKILNATPEELTQINQGFSDTMSTSTGAVPSLVTGAAKGAADTVMSTGKLAYPVAYKVGSALGIPMQKPEDAEKVYNEQIKPALEAKNTGEAVGKTAEQLAEFLLPAGVISKVGKVEKGASLAQKALGLGKKVIAEGVTSGTVTAAQGGTGQDIAETAAFSAALPILGTALKAAKGFIKNGEVRAARNEIAKLIKPDKNAYLFGKDPALAVAQKGIVANSWDDLVKKISNVKNEAGIKIQSAVDAADATKTTSVADLIQANVDDFALKNADTATQKTYIAKMQDLINKTVPDLASGEVKIIGKVPIESMNAPQLWELQKKVGQLTKWTNQAGESEANKQLHKLYRALGQRLDELAPGTKAAQTEYANFLGAEKAARARAAVATRNTNSLTAIGGVTAGAVIAGAQGSKPEDFIRNAVIGAGLPAIIRSPFFKTRVAKILAKESGHTPEVVTNVLNALAKYGIANR